MASPELLQEEMARLQKLSNEFVPDVQGALVGHRVSSEALVAEYAEADPVYIRKTAALPLTYSHYRTIKGDGNCGWRAVAFNYFELLFRLQDLALIQREESRIRSLSNLMNRVGLSDYLYEDFVDATLRLLRATAVAVAMQHSDSLLLQAFNDPEVSSSIIAHFRCVTSAFMKINHSRYQPFILDGSVDQYCSSQIDPVAIEIEHIGMKALIDALIEPAGFAVEIIYLDRSDSDQVNTHRFDAAHPAAPVLRLLYRPGHYDLLYTFEDVATTPQLPHLPAHSDPTAGPASGPALPMHLATWDASDASPSNPSQFALSPRSTQNTPVEVHSSTSNSAPNCLDTALGDSFADFPQPSSFHPSAVDRFIISPTPLPCFNPSPAFLPRQRSLPLHSNSPLLASPWNPFDKNPLAPQDTSHELNCFTSPTSNMAHFNNREFQPAQFDSAPGFTPNSPTHTYTPDEFILAQSLPTNLIMAPPAYSNVEANQPSQPSSYDPGFEGPSLPEGSLEMFPGGYRYVHRLDEANGPSFADNYLLPSKPCRNASKDSYKDLSEPAAHRS
ncbi:MAG: hypothetical protein M1829_006459 [Trizodia sp. TS-e1964]|nr:MAG: hypothetical protein M1829_006459 [Trizodia sp. TS-e1964]